jgi:hypothetical protein
VDFVDKQDVISFQGSQYACQIAGFVQYRTGSDFKSNIQFIGDDVGQSSFSQTGRAVKQNMVERFTSLASSRNENFQVLNDFILSAETLESQWPERVFEFSFLLIGNIIV